MKPGIFRTYTEFALLILSIICVYAAIGAIALWWVRP